MPKKKFIDKKNSVTFNLVHRSQRDPLAADEDAPQRIFIPADQKQRPKSDADSKQKRREDQIKCGIYFDDDYDYMQHLKDTDRKTVWEQVPTSDPRISKLNLPKNVFASETEEAVGMLNKAAPQGLNLDVDPDLVEAMDDDFDFDDPENQLEDNFVELAQGGVDTGDDDEGEDQYDEGSNFSFEEDDEVGSLENFDEIETKTKFTEYSMSSSVMRRNEQLSLLDQRFEKMYLEQYDDQEIGALDHDEIDNERANTANEMLMRYIREHQKEQEIKRLPDSEYLGKIGDDLDESETKYVDVTPKIEYDCQSILTLNSENKYRYKPKVIPNPPRKIQIHPTTGMPMNVLGAKSNLTVKSLAEFDAQNRKFANGTSVAESVISRLTTLSMRSKNETPEEKRERKHALKEYRRERRMEKKANMLAFKEEKKRQEKIMLNLKQNVQGIK